MRWVWDDIAFYGYAKPADVKKAHQEKAAAGFRALVDESGDVDMDAGGGAPANAEAGPSKPRPSVPAGDSGEEGKSHVKPKKERKPKKKPVREYTLEKISKSVRVWRSMTRC